MSRVVKDTTAAWCKKQNEFIKEAMQKKISKGFRIGGSSNVIGAIDGTHLPLMRHLMSTGRVTIASMCRPCVVQIVCYNVLYRKN